jgi:hypothetical protein
VGAGHRYVVRGLHHRIRLPVGWRKIADKIEKEIKSILSSTQNRIDLNVIVGLPEELEKSVTDEISIKIDEMFIGIKRI